MTRCIHCDIEMIDGQCPECFSIELTEMWRRQDMREMLTRCERDPLKHVEPKNRRAA